MLRFGYTIGFVPHLEPEVHLWQQNPSKNPIVSARLYNASSQYVFSLGIVPVALVLLVL